MSMNEKDIARLVGSQMFKKGKAYYEEGRVLSVDMGQEIMKASVQGSKAKPYRVSVNVGVKPPVLSCTCPTLWSGPCKHAVAVLLYLCHRGVLDLPLTTPFVAQAKEKRPTSSKIKKETLINEEKEKEVTSLLTQGALRGQLRCVLSTQAMRDGQCKSWTLQIWFHEGDRRVALTSRARSSVSLLKGFWGGATEGLALSPSQQYLLQWIENWVKARDNRAGSSQIRLNQEACAALLEMTHAMSDVEIIDGVTQEKIFLDYDNPLRLTLEIKRKGKGLICRFSLPAPWQQIKGDPMARIFGGQQLWFWDVDGHRLLPLPREIDRRFFFLCWPKEYVFNPEQSQWVLVQWLGAMSSFVDIVQEGKPYQPLLSEAGVLKSQWQVEERRGRLQIRGQWLYGSYALPCLGGDDKVFIEPTDPALPWVKRDRDAEKRVLEAAMLVKGARIDEKSQSIAIDNDDDIFDFFRTGLSQLQNLGEVMISTQVKEMFDDTQIIRPSVQVMTEGIDWFEYRLSYTLNQEKMDIDHQVVMEQLMQGKMYLRAKSGRFYSLDETSFNAWRDLVMEHKHEGRMMVSQLPYLVDTLKETGITLDMQEALSRVYEGLKGQNGLVAAELPTGLKTILRDYQHQGVSWLAFLRQHHLHGVLADDMGLGKTIQALTMLKKMLDEEPSLPHLVVCPSTLVWNWEAEIKKFLPDVKPLIIVGHERESLLEEMAKAQIIITSYALLRRDIKYYRENQFAYVVLDEAQNIKNRHTINAQVTKQLRAKYRLALTGTPLENSIADIWSIFDFLMPGFLNTYDKFRRHYEWPIIQQTPGVLKDLSRRIAPFVLRRLKKDVIKELPQRIEQVSYCELGPTQARLYSQMAQQARQQAVEAYQQKGLDKSRMYILTLLLRLRQMCCHPSLAGLKLKHDVGISAKMDHLKELLLESLSSGHRVLIFSQFVEMLSLLKQYCDHEGIRYAYMDGQSRKRQETVDAFNQDTSIGVFLLSLKVGGVGLNLTGADTVILYEPWWNPAVEQQAIDRAHRIGQQKSVLAYHLIAKGTIEEKILQLQERKRHLFDALVESQEVMANGLNWEDIKFLLDIEEKVK